MKTLLMMVAGVLPLATLTKTPSMESSTPLIKENKSCGCSIDSKPQSTPQAKAMKRACVAKADVEQLCTLTSTTLETWCASGGIFAYCETDGDNDGDGIYGEPHFMQKRYILTYNCTTGPYVVCGDWTPMKIGGGSSGQDVCCKTTAPQPPCPANSCPPNP